MPIWTSSRSGSTAANHAAAASSFTDCSNRRSLSNRFPTDLWSNVRQCRPSETTRCWGHGSDVNTHLAHSLLIIALGPFVPLFLKTGSPFDIARSLGGFITCLLSCVVSFGVDSTNQTSEYSFRALSIRAY